MAQRDRPSLVGTDPVIKATSAQTETFIGQMVARRRGLVASRLAGPVSRINVQIGDHVSKGDVIAEIGIDDVLAERDVSARQLDRAVAALEASEAQLGLARQERQRLEKLRRERLARHWERNEKRSAGLRHAFGFADGFVNDRVEQAHKSAYFDNNPSPRLREGVREAWGPTAPAGGAGGGGIVPASCFD